MLTTSQARNEWAPACKGPFTSVALYGSGVVSVRSQIIEAVHALSDAFKAWDYKTRKADTGAYNCRKITNGTGYSLHAYGIAIDVNWNSNPYGSVLKTNMPKGMIAAIKAIRTNNGKEVWRWGGDYTGNKDAMHFEIVCTKADLATGIKTKVIVSTDTPIQEEQEVMRLVYCDPARNNEAPELAGAWFKTNGTISGTDWVPTKGHATALKNMGLLAEDSPVPVSPNLLKELKAKVPSN